MDQTHHFPADRAIPTWQEPAAARRELRSRMETFIRAAADGDLTDGEECTALTLKVSAGVGDEITSIALTAAQWNRTMCQAMKCRGASQQLAVHLPDRKRAIQRTLVSVSS